MSIFVTIFCIIFMAIGVLLALHMGLYRTLLRIGTGIAAVVFSILLTNIVSPMIAKSLPAISSLADDTSVREIFFLIPSLRSFEIDLVTALVSIPVLLIALFLFAIIFCIVYHIIKKYVPSRKETKNKYLLIPSSILGAVMGLASACMILAPFSYVIDIAAEATPILASIDESAPIANVLTDFDNNVFIKLSASTPFSTPLDIGTSYDLGSESTTLRNSIKSTVSLASNIFIIFDSETDGYDAEFVNKTLEQAKENIFIKTLGAEFVSNFATQLSAGETVLEISYDEMFGDISQSAPEVSEKLLLFLSETTTETISEDITTVAELLLAFDQSGFLDIVSDSGDITEALSDTAMLKQIILPLTKNERASLLIDAIVYVGLEASAELAGIPADSYEVYDKMLSELSDVLLTDDTDSEKAENIRHILTTYGVNADVTVMEKLVRIVGTQTNKDEAKAAFIAASLQLSESDESNREVLSAIADKNKFSTDRATVSTIMDSFSNNKNSSSLDPEEKAENIAAAVSSVISIANSFGTSDMIVSSDIINAVGNSAAAVLKSELVDTTTLQGLVSGIFENAQTSSDVDLNLIADSINSAIESDSSGKGIEDLAHNASAGLTIAESIAAGNKVEKESVKTFIDTMTPNSANTLKASVSKALFVSGGASEIKSDVCNDLIQNVIENIEKFDTTDSDMLNKEAESLTTLINFTNDIMDKKEDTDVFTDISVTPTELVEQILSSQIVSMSVIDACSDENGVIIDPYGFANSLNETEKSEIETALNASLANNSDKIKDVEMISALLLGKTW